MRIFGIGKENEPRPVDETSSLSAAHEAAMAHSPCIKGSTPDSITPTEPPTENGPNWKWEQPDAKGFSLTLNTALSSFPLPERKQIVNGWRAEAAAKGQDALEKLDERLRKQGF